MNVKKSPRPTFLLVHLPNRVQSLDASTAQIPLPSYKGKKASAHSAAFTTKNILYTIISAVLALDS